MSFLRCQYNFTLLKIHFINFKCTHTHHIQNFFCSFTNNDRYSLALLTERQCYFNIYQSAGSLLLQVATTEPILHQSQTSPVVCTGCPPASVADWTHSPTPAQILCAAQSAALSNPSPKIRQIFLQFLETLWIEWNPGTFLDLNIQYRSSKSDKWRSFGVYLRCMCTWKMLTSWYW